MKNSAKSERQRAIDAIRPGDIVYGTGAGGQPKLLLVDEVDENHIKTHQIATGFRISFRRDGKTGLLPDGGSCIIVSTAALPAEQYATATGLDRKMQTAKEPADYKLSRTEVDLLLGVREFFEARPLPE